MSNDLPASSSARTPRVLCADDEPAIREVLRALLRREGFEVETADNGAEALRVLEAAPGRFDVLITDNEMPLLPGTKLAQRVRAARLPVKIIVFSALQSPEDEQAFRNADVDALVPKGAPIGDLVREIRRAAKPTR